MVNKVGELHNPETHLIPILVNKVLNDKEFKVYGDNYETKDGTCIRDYIHIIDLCRAFENTIKLMEVKKIKSVINLGSNKGFSVFEIIKQIKKNILVKNNKVKFSIVNNRKGDHLRLVCSNLKAKKIIKWLPKNSDLKKIILDEKKWQLFLKNKNYKIKTIY